MNAQCGCGHAYESHVVGGGRCAVNSCHCAGFLAPGAAPLVGIDTGVDFDGPEEPPDAAVVADQREHMAVLVQAYDLYCEREKERGGGWKRGGVKAATLNIYAKAERAFHQVMRGEQPNPDHFIDLINYAVFALRLGADMNGKWPWPDEERK